MPDYKKMYANLFNAVTDVIEILKQAQIETENIYIDSSEQEGKNILKLKMINTEDNNNLED